MRRSQYKTSVTYDGLDVNHLHEMICAFLELVDDFILMIHDEDYRLKFNENHDLEFISKRKANKVSPIESLIFSDYFDNLELMKNLVDNYPVALSCLNEEQKIVFRSIYYDRLTHDEITERYPELYRDKTKRILKEAVVIFSLKSGLYKFQNDYAKL